MNLSLINGPAFDAITPWLPAIDAILKSTALLVLTAGVSLFLRRASAATRHMIWTLGLLGALVLPALSLAVPRWQLPLVMVAGQPAVDAGRSALDDQTAPPASEVSTAAAPDLRVSRATANAVGAKADRCGRSLCTPPPALPSPKLRTPARCHASPLASRLCSAH